MFGKYIKQYTPKSFHNLLRLFYLALRDRGYLINRIRYFLGQETLVINRNGHDFYLNTLDWRSFRIAGTQRTQEKALVAWRKLALLHPRRLVDIGSNYGEFVSEVVGLSIPITAVEPNPLVFNCLQKSFGSFSQVSLFNIAVSTNDSELSFFFNPTYSGGGSLHENVINKGFNIKYISPYIQNKTIKRDVTAFTLDRVLDFRWPESLVLKIDIEGHEPLVLDSILPKLEQIKWFRILLEFNYSSLSAANNDPNSFWKRLRNLPTVLLDSKSGEYDFRLAPVKSTLPEEPIHYGDVVIFGGSVS